MVKGNYTINPLARIVIELKCRIIQQLLFQNAIHLNESWLQITHFFTFRFCDPPPKKKSKKKKRNRMKESKIQRRERERVYLWETDWPLLLVQLFYRRPRTGAKQPFFFCFSYFLLFLLFWKINGYGGCDYVFLLILCGPIMGSRSIIAIN